MWQVLKLKDLDADAVAASGSSSSHKNSDSEPGRRRSLSDIIAEADNEHEEQLEWCPWGTDLEILRTSQGSTPAFSAFQVSFSKSTLRRSLHVTVPYCVRLYL